MVFDGDLKYCLSINVKEAERLLITGLLNHSITHAELVDTIFYLKKRKYTTSLLANLTQSTSYKIRHCVMISRNLNTHAKDLLHLNKISFSMARALAEIPVEKQKEMLPIIIRSKMSVNAFRMHMSNLKKNIEVVDVNVRKIENDISDRIGFTASVTRDSHASFSGSLSFRFTSLDEFESLIQLIPKLSDLMDGN